MPALKARGGAGPGFGALDPATRISPRAAPRMIGLGLVKASPDAASLTHADPDDTDGNAISGRSDMVWSPEYETTVPGRFEARANTQTPHRQAGDALSADIGIASPLRFGPADDGYDAARRGVEMPGQSVDLVTFHCHNHAVPRRADVDDLAVLRGKGLFSQAGCTA